ncbi:MAG: hypothetical protein ACEY3J_01950 [Arsenophonus sp.]
MLIPMHFLALLITWDIWDIKMLSLEGIAITLDFIGKFYLIITAINDKLWLLTAIVNITNAMGLYYYSRFMASL